MVRSAAALAAALILAGFTLVQQVTTHTVVKGDTLWDLAQTYYGNPFQWRRIWQANKDRVADPNLILPGWVLTIPDKETQEAQVGAVTVQTPPPPADTTAAAAAPAKPDTMAPLQSVSAQPTSKEPSVFRVTQPQGSVGGTAATPHLAVSHDAEYSAPWLVREGREPESMGTLRAMADPESITQTPRRFSRVRVMFQGSPPAVGTELRIFRITKTISDVGRVASPTGTLTISSVDGDSAVAMVSQEYGRIQLGDQVGPLPPFSLQPGQYAQAVSSGSEAMVVGFAGEAVDQDIGAVAFLDQGTDQGVAVGDEYDLVDPTLGSHPVLGVLQVVSVTRDGASARIVHMVDAVFRQGVAVRLSRKIQ